ncbi:hypothetical protein [Bradyrhizobium liaoningense]
MNFTEWASGSEMLDSLRDKHLIRLESGAEGINRYYEIDLPSQYDALNVVIFSTGHREPTVLWLEGQSKLILACDNWVHKVDLAAKKVEYSRKLTGVFYEFLWVDEAGACTVLHQLGILRLELNGAIRWSVDTGIVENFVRIDSDTIRLAVLDEQSLYVDLKTGATTKFQDTTLR